MKATRAARHPAPIQRSEHKLQAMLIDYVTNTMRRRMYAFAIPNAARRSFALAAKMKAEGLRAGVADVAVMMPYGRMGWLELKSERGTMSDEQYGFQAICNRFEHPHAVIRSYDQGTEILQLWKRMYCDERP